MEEVQSVVEVVHEEGHNTSFIKKKVQHIKEYIISHGKLLHNVKPLTCSLFCFSEKAETRQTKVYSILFPYEAIDWFWSEHNLCFFHHLCFGAWD